MAKNKRTYNQNLIKKLMCYSVKDIASLYDLHTHTVLSWLKNGLKAIDDKIPRLVHGTDLAEYLTTRQSARKQKLSPDQFYCFKCQKARHARAGSVQDVPTKGGKLMCQARCEVCDTRMNRARSKP